MFEFEPLNTGNKMVEVTITSRQMQRAEDRRRDIYDSHRHRTFALAFYMTGNEIEAEKILTDTFVAAFSAAPEPSAQDVDAALVTELRSRFSLNAQAPMATPEYAEPGSANLSQRNVRRTDLEEAIQTLPDSERLLFLLRDVEGYTSAAISKLLQIPETQVNRSLLSARIRLRRALAEGQEAAAEAA
ncbi:RNA polymerase sigma-70 factor (ECF subfamily) [Silvibacterium bohemicum]|uniref:RNA polymerase sigma-70 factor (ECF subfamily) n=1 Tax=Silvibacterium bohemicum TaxID=1577686 RepID=A0A841K0A6_9BACT|nr:sigma-70 family RNA polymerase sigma factor [Silvibacterium bohemicum]MBB6145389.1 RNA polymerase sigma-70 factor (ECF subfamily) [Silvibacterium bohemicum]